MQIRLVGCTLVSAQDEQANKRACLFNDLVTFSSSTGIKTRLHRQAMITVRLWIVIPRNSHRQLTVHASATQGMTPLASGAVSDGAESTTPASTSNMCRTVYSTKVAETTSSNMRRLLFLDDEKLGGKRGDMLHTVAFSAKLADWWHRSLLQLSS